MPIHYPDSTLKSAWARRPEVSVKAAILGAGLGRRLEPLTQHLLPKPMFPLGGKVPISEMWLRSMAESGLSDVSFNVCVLKETIKDHFNTGAKFGVNLNFVEEVTPTGTLGGVCKQVFGNQAKKLATDEPLSFEPFAGSTVIAPSADIVTNFGPELLEEMFEHHRRKGAAFSIVLSPIPKERRGDFGTVVLDRPQKLDGPLSEMGQVSAFIEKDPNSPSVLNNASIYMIETELLAALDPLRTSTDTRDNPFYDFGKHVFPALLGKLDYAGIPKGKYPIWGIQYDGEWFDVGNKRDYLKVNREILDGTFRIPLAYEQLPWGFLGNNVSLDFNRVEIHPPVVIGNDCVIEPGATLGPYAVIGDGWRIRKGATISRSVLWERYAFFPGDGRKLNVSQRREVDAHEVGAVHVKESIVAGGLLEQDIVESTTQVLEDGTLQVKPIDYVPPGPRA